MEKKTLTTTQVELLKKPLPKEAVSKHPTKTYLSSIKAIYVIERLNDVFGIGSYQFENREIVKEGKMVVVESILTIPEYGIRIPSYGGNDNTDLGDAYKGAATDALTKICSYLGIGMDVFKGLGDAPKSEAKTERPKPENQKQFSPEKPKMNEAQLNRVIERIGSGETEAYNAALNAFDLNDDQKKQLKETYDFQLLTK